MQEWLSVPRHAVYLAAAGGDEKGALLLYEWNAQLGSALHRDLSHLEIALRNAYDRALTQHWPGPPHWTLQGHRVFAPLYRSKGGRRVDVNVRRRQALDDAIASAGGPSAAPGKVIAELMFGFWRYLSSSAHEKTLWLPAVHHAFPPGTNRADIDRIVRRLHALRNRVAHHEPLLRADVPTLYTELATLTGLLNTDLGQHLRATSRVPALLARHP